MKVVLNKCYGSFNLSLGAAQYLANKYGFTLCEGWQAGFDAVIEPDGYVYFRNEDTENFRSDPRIIEVVELMGRKAGGPGTQLEIVEAPDDENWYITDYDGIENIRGLYYE